MTNGDKDTSQSVGDRIDYMTGGFADDPSDNSSDLDNLSNVDFGEPDQDNSQTPVKQTEEGTAETSEEDGPQSEEATEESESNPGDADKGAEDEPVITLKGGEQVKLAELTDGYMRRKDYSQKTAETANIKRNLESMTARVTNTINAVAEVLASQLPPEPDYSLAVRDPYEYTRQRAVYDAGLSRINQVIELANEPKSVADNMTQEQRQQLVEAESERLAESFPQTRTPEGRERFFNDTFALARDFGFSDDEMRDVVDHRIHKMAYYARLGVEAEKAKQKAMNKVANAPLTTAPQKQRQNLDSQRNKEAMAKLRKTGSIKDAVKVDFDFQ